LYPFISECSYSTYEEEEPEKAAAEPRTAVNAATVNFIFQLTSTKDCENRVLRRLTGKPEQEIFGRVRMSALLLCHVTFVAGI
jgi:hypothetical protein